MLAGEQIKTRFHNQDMDHGLMIDPDQRAFEQLVEATFDNLPEVFRKACKGIVIRSVDFADDDVLRSLDIDNPYDLLGLYHGVNLTHKSAFDLPLTPDMVLIYRKPIILYANTHKLSLEDVVQHVVVHEIGHHMGFSDEDMEAMEVARDGFYHDHSDQTES